MSSKPFDNKPKHSGAGLATTIDVIKAFWVGSKPNLASLVITILAVFVARAADLAVPVFYKKFFDIVNMADLPVSVRAHEMMAVIVQIFGLYMILWAGYRVVNFFAGYFQTKVMARLKQQAFDHMIDHSYSFYANNFTGSLVQRVNRFARAFETVADKFTYDILSMVIQVVGICTVLWFHNPLISIVLMIWVLVFMLFNYLFSVWKLKYDVKRASMDSYVTGVLSDAVANQNTIQLFTGKKFESDGFKKVTDEQGDFTRFTWNLQGVVDAIQSLLIFIIEFLLFYFAIKYWERGLITAGTFVLIQIYIVALIMRLWDLSRVIRSVYEAFADAKEMVDIMKLPHDIKNVPDAKTLSVPTGEVRFDNVSFQFNAERIVLNKINLIIKPGEKVAIIGPSGAGKSTFVKLLLRLYDVSSGAVLIDGQDISKVTQESLRHNVSLVPQDPILFHRTLLENIRYGRRNATDEEVYEAARLAHCDEFAKSLKDGYGTYVGERGVKLSGGERQRVAIARAILKNAPILVLDEATSSLDSHSEHLIQDALDKLMKGKTTIVIAHRLSTIRMMDRIIVIEKGKVIEEGSHDELLKDGSSLYKKLWNLQAGGFLEDDEKTNDDLQDKAD